MLAAMTNIATVRLCLAILSGMFQVHDRRSVALETNKAELLERFFWVD